MIYRTTRYTLSLIFSLTLITALLSGDLLRASAAGGAFDNTFDGNGRLATDFSGGQDVINDIVIQPDGKIIAVGTTDPADSSVSDLSAIARYHPNGTLDTTFGGDGRVTVYPASLGGSALNAVTLQPDGKMVAVGRVLNAGLNDYQMTIMRLLSNGDLDTSFSGDGVINNGGFLGPSEANAVAIQPNGAILVVGRGSPGFTLNVDMAIARFTPAGTPDTTFSGDGITTIDFGGTTSEVAHGVHVLANGKILVGGSVSNDNLGLARLNSSGTLDNTFDLDGKVITDVPGSAFAYDMKIQSDGKIVLAGGTGLDNLIVRYTAEGNLDGTFGTGGVVYTSVSPLEDRSNEIAIQADGKLVSVSVSPFDFEIIRYRPNGSLDLSFGVNGILRSDMTNGSSDTAYSVAIQSDGKIVVAGSTRNTSSGATTNFCVARYLPNSAPFDFDGDGKTDVAIFRPAVTGGEWWWQRSSNNQVPAVPFGLASDVVAPGDFTGDGKLDITVWRPSNGFWYVLRSEDNSFYGFPFGASGDVPMTADYDGDGKDDPTVFRASVGLWFITRSSNNQVQTVQFGLPGDVPVAADYDGDGKADVAIKRSGPNGAEWWINRSTQGVVALIFGASTDRAVPGDYTGDGKADVALFRPSTGVWSVLRSEDFSFYGFPFGQNGDQPVSGDYDGDGRIDPAIFRPSTNTWFIDGSTSGMQIQNFGIAGDRPIPNAFVR